MAVTYLSNMPPARITHIYFTLTHPQMPFKVGHTKHSTSVYGIVVTSLISQLNLSRDHYCLELNFMLLFAPGL